MYTKSLNQAAAVTIDQYISTTLKPLYQAAELMQPLGANLLPQEGVWHQARVLVGTDGQLTVWLEPFQSQNLFDLLFEQHDLLAQQSSPEMSDGLGFDLGIDQVQLLAPSEAQLTCFKFTDIG